MINDNSSVSMVSAMISDMVADSDSSLPAEDLFDESGNPLLDEDNQQLVTT